MIFNPCSSIDFMPELELDGNELKVVEEIRLLGLVISSDMKWVSNTNNMVKKANKKLWILRRLKFLGATELDLEDIYIKQVRCLLELAVPAWHGAITLAWQSRRILSKFREVWPTSYLAKTIYHIRML